MRLLETGKRKYGLEVLKADFSMFDTLFYFFLHAEPVMTPFSFAGNAQL